MFDSQVSLVNRSQGLEKKKKEHSRKSGLVAAQYNGIAACAYSLKIFTVHTLLYLTIICSIKTSFIFLFDKWAHNDPVWGRLPKRPHFSSFWKTGSYTLFGLIARAMRMSMRFLFRFFRYCWRDASLTIHDGVTNRYSNGSIRHFCLQPNIRDE